MKKLTLLIVAFALPFVMFAQQNSADKIFEKYAGKEGLTTVVVNKSMFKMLAGMDEENENLQDLAGIESIKILVVEEEGVLTGVNFFDEVMKDLNTSNYEELISVKKLHQKVKILVKESQGIIRELLIVAGGEGEDNALVIIRGNIDLKNLGSLSCALDMDQLAILEELELEK